MEGVIAAVPTPVDGSGQPLIEPFLDHARWALETGCHGLNVLGTTGEATSIEPSQRMRLMESAASALPDASLMVGTGVPDLATTVALTRHAEACGFAAALLLPPFYYKPLPPAALEAWIAAIVEATDRIPLYLYHFPKLSGVPWPVEVAASLARRFPGRVVGAKDSSGDLDYARELAEIPNFRVFPSDEATLALRNADKFAGCISATVNIDPATARALWDSPDDRTLLRRAKAVRAAAQALPLIPAVKTAVALRTGEDAWKRALPPHLPLSDADAVKLKVALDATRS